MEQPTHTKMKLTNLLRQPKGRRSQRKTDNRMTGKPEKYAYTFRDPEVGELQVLNTSYAWWKDGVKLQKLVDAYKYLCTDDQACFYAGITIDQLKYFQELHNGFYPIKHAAKQRPTLQAKKALFSNIEKNTEDAKWLLERIEKDTFSTRQEQTGKDGRDLYDGLTERYKKLTEDVANLKTDDDSDTNKKHAGDDAPANPDAGQDGNRDAAEPAKDTPGPSKDGA